MALRPTGSNVTYWGDFLVSDQLDAIANFIISAKFILEQWPMLCGKTKKIIAGRFKHKKETPGKLPLRRTIWFFLGLRPKLIPAFAAEEKAEAKILIAKQKRDVYEAELWRREKKAQIARAREEIQRRAKQALRPDSK